MPYQTDDLRIRQIKELLPPIALLERFQATEVASKTVFEGRQAISNILNRKDDRLLVIIGPCSIHDPIAAGCQTPWVRLRWRTAIACGQWGACGAGGAPRRKRVRSLRSLNSAGSTAGAADRQRE